MSVTLPPPQTKEFADRLTTLAMECRDELEQSSQALQEIALLLNQTKSEVDRLAQRETQQNSRLRELEASIESYSRTEIRDAYTAAHDVQLRLFMMRNQLEVLESRSETIQQQQEKLRILLNLAEVNREHTGETTTIARTVALHGGTSMLGAAFDFAPELIQAREGERVRISRQLADGPAQVLANLILRTEIVKRIAERDPEQLDDELGNLRDMAAKSLLDVRRAIFEMRPLVLDELGLVPTLRRYATEFARDNGASISIDGPDRDDQIARHTCFALFRLIQQAMIAMVSPGIGTTLRTDVRFEEAQVGIRMDASQIAPKVPALVARFVEDPYTQETLELIGGSIQQEPLANGLRVTIVVPLGL